MTTEQEQRAINGFKDVESVVSNSEKFKIKLGIGRDAYTSLKASKTVVQLWDLAGVAGTGAKVASSGFVASKFFETTTTLWIFGTTAAVTPIGWVIAAALLSGGAYCGVTHLCKSYAGSRVDEIPKFLNTGIDVLAVSLFDLMGSLALKVAAIDGSIDPTERSAIKDYFAKEWGYDHSYLDHAMSLLEDNIERTRLADMASELSLFVINNPDCNFDAMQTEIKNLLIKIAEADGSVDEREEMAIERIHRSLAEHGSMLTSTGKMVSGTAKSIGDLASGTGSSIKSTLAGVARKLWTKKS